MISKEQWEREQEWEKEWHDSNNHCANSYNEETKQFDYATRMGLDVFKKTQYGIVSFDFGDKSVIDIGGGPYSLLLKSKAKERFVADPCDYPKWVRMRYAEDNITYMKIAGEDLDQVTSKFDIGLMYNVLQHTQDPEKICRNALKLCKVLYVFDWLEIGVSNGHPQNLHKQEMDKWLGGEGRVAPAIRGFMYYGVFKGENYDK